MKNFFVIKVFKKGLTPDCSIECIKNDVLMQFSRRI